MIISKRRRVKDVFLSNTSVENLFIHEYLPDAPGDYVKAYLFLLMCSELEKPMSSDTILKTLKMTEEQINEAMAYWAERDLVTISTDKEGNTIYKFNRMIEEIFGMSARRTEEVDMPGEEGEDVSAGDIIQTEMGDVSLNAYNLSEKEVRELFNRYEFITGRTISRKETGMIENLLITFGVTPDVILYAMKYCSERGHNEINYISKVACSWAEAGCKTSLDVKNHIDETEKQKVYYRKIFDELGLKRNPVPAETEMMDRWVDELGFDWDEVIAACRTAAGIREPNLRYVNKVLENKAAETGGICVEVSADARKSSSLSEEQKNNPPEKTKAKVSKRVLDDYYAYLRECGERDLNKRQDEACEKIAHMRDLLDAERELRNRALLFDLSEEGRKRREQDMSKLKSLDETKRKHLRKFGFSEDYLEMQYRCSICKDTGITDRGEICTCAKDRANEAYIWQKKRRQE